MSCGCCCGAMGWSVGTPGCCWRLSYGTEQGQSRGVVVVWGRGSGRATHQALWGASAMWGQRPAASAVT